MDTVRNCAPDVLLVSTDMLKEELGELERLIAEIQIHESFYLPTAKMLTSLKVHFAEEQKASFNVTGPFTRFPSRFAK